MGQCKCGKTQSDKGMCDGSHKNKDKDNANA